MAEQLTLFKVRDLRKKDQFKIDDAYLNGYARVCGIDATAVYNSLCRHAEFQTQKAFPSQQKIAYEHKISVRTVRRGLKKLIDYKIVIAEQIREKGKFRSYLYTLLNKSEWKKITEGQNRPMVDGGTKTDSRFTAYGVGPTKDNKEQRITNIKDNTELATPSVAGKEINDLIEKFKEVNPSYQRLFRNKTQRSALERMVKSHGQEKIEKILEIIPKMNGKQYAPVITTPIQLEEKLGLLIAFINKERNKSKMVIEI